MLRAVNFLHVNSIFHGDLKLENVVISASGKVKIIDFGLSEVIRPGQTSARWCCSANYRAPEVLTKQPHDLKADVWSLGVTLHGLATGEYPFAASPQYKHANEVLAGQPKLEGLRAKYGDDLADFVASMLSVRPEDRPTVQQCLAHRWFRKGE
jgi:serine/threonine protein kinase